MPGGGGSLDEGWIIPWYAATASLMAPIDGCPIDGCQRSNPPLLVPGNGRSGHAGMLPHAPPNAPYWARLAPFWAPAAPRAVQRGEGAVLGACS